MIDTLLNHIATGIRGSEWYETIGHNVDCSQRRSLEICQELNHTDFQCQETQTGTVIMCVGEDVCQT